MAESKSEAPTPAKSPNQTDPVVAAIAAERKAAASILPSRPMSKIPARSENNPARQAKSNGVARRRELSKTCKSVRKSIVSIPLAAGLKTSVQADVEPLRSEPQ